MQVQCTLVKYFLLAVSPFLAVDPQGRAFQSPHFRFAQPMFRYTAILITLKHSIPSQETITFLSVRQGTTPNEGFIIDPGLSSCSDSFGCGAIAIPPSSVQIKIINNS